jgi:hypothetical protein
MTSTLNALIFFLCKQGEMMRAVAGLGLAAMIGLVGFVGTASPGPLENSAPAPAPSTTAPATPAPPASVVPSTTTATAAADNRNRIICRSRVATGSRLAYTRDCHTQMEWDVITRTGRDYINGQQLKAMEAGKPGT